MTNKKFGVCADGKVGVEIIKFFINNHPECLKVVVVVDDGSDVYTYLKNQKYPNTRIIFHKSIYDQNTIDALIKHELDYLVLAWWPFIIKKNLYGIPSVGTINFHPSFLPFNRGKHYNFWTIVEETQFGVTIHFVDDSIDGGDIIFQNKIDKTWEDTGESLYYKAQKSIVELFTSNFNLLLSCKFNRIKQNVMEGSFHHSSELVPASEIVLDKQYKAKELLNLLRARTFSGYPSCYFFDAGRKYEVRIQIKEIK